MAQPLFTADEITQHKNSFRGLEWNEREARERAHQIETIRRVHERPEEYLRGLIIIVAEKGAFYVDFTDIFSHSDSSEYLEKVARYNTPENRRMLHTILKALTEIPRNWARSAFVRFLRGIGKQKGFKYYGAGMLGPQYGWTGREVNAVCEVIAGDRSPFAQVLMFYNDVKGEIEEADSEYEVVEYGAEFKATRVERDTDFLNVLCNMLEADGLASMPEARQRAEKKPHVPKIFKPGDIIRDGTIRDLPLPARVSIPIIKCTKKNGARPEDWKDDSLEQVVTKIMTGRCLLARVVPANATVAYRPIDQFGQGKNVLIGATYLGPWTGKIERGREVKYNFQFRYKSDVRD